ncbi:MAG: hypothetical protein KGQ87_03865 [Verrucomicrobia bacterium]|nr:hypothetical protein [Verrucomicrobiota bacterium]
MIFPITQRIKQPTVIIAHRTQIADSVRTVQLAGTYHLVMPSNAREVLALQMLEHQIDKFAPAEGNGVLISESAHRKLNA